MAEQENTQEPMSGTHPIAIIGLAAGVFSVLFGGICLLDPRLAALIQGLLGLLSLGTSAGTFMMVKSQKIEDHNLFQAKLALLFGGLGASISAAWWIWIYFHPNGY